MGRERRKDPETGRVDHGAALSNHAAFWQEARKDAQVSNMNLLIPALCP